MNVTSAILATALFAPSAFSAVDPLSAAVKGRVLSEALAGSSETIAMNALADADIAAEFAWEALRTPDEFTARQRELRRKFVAALGGFPARTPLEARTTGEIGRDGYRIEKVVFSSQLGFFVTANLYFPMSAKNGAGLPGLLVPCGHSPDGKASENYQRAGIFGARAGFVTLVYDPSDQGERVQDPKYRVARGHNKWGALANRLGWNFGRIRVWDAMRALDYLQARPEVDGERLCVAGNSGGGTVTALVMALDDRLKASAPSCYVSSLRDVFNQRFPSDAEQEQFGQLAFGLNHLGYLLLRAPMPVLVCCQSDDAFPYRGSMNSVAHARTVMERFGWTNRMAMVCGTGPHCWPRGNQVATMAWLRHWVTGDEMSLPSDFAAHRQKNVGYRYHDKDYAYRQETSETLPPEELFAAPGGSVTNIPGFRTVADLIREEFLRLEKARVGKVVSREEVATLAGIRTNGRPQAVCTVLGVETVGGIRVERLSFFTPDGAQLPAVLLTLSVAKTGAVLVCGDGARIDRMKEAQEFLAKGSPVLLPDMAGWGELGKFRRKFYDQIVSDETLAMTWYPVGRTLVGIRAENILDCAEYLKSRFGAPVALVAKGRAVIPAVHAVFVAPGLFDGFVKQIDPPLSWSDEIRRDAKCNYADSVFGALKVYDWPELSF